MNILKKTTFAAVAAAATCLAQATVSISIDAEGLTKGDGTSMSSGVAVLVASTTDGSFAQPTAGQLVNGDDRVLAVWDLSETSVDADAFGLLAQSIAYDSDLGADDPVGLYWYPNLAYNDGNPSPSGTEVFGFYTDTSGDTYGDAWKLPEGGALLHSLKVFMQGASSLVEMGNIPDVIGQAMFSIGGQAVAEATAADSGASSEANPGTVTLTFSGTSSAPNGEVVVQRRLKGEDFWEIVGVPSGNSFDDDSIGRGKEYEYRVVAINGYGSDSSDIISAAKTLRSNLVNISTRGVMGAGNKTMIAGYGVYGGSEKIHLVSRALGPALSYNRGLDVNVVVPDPFSILAGVDPAITNFDWDDGGVAAEMNQFFRDVGADELQEGQGDSAIVADLDANAIYTVLAGGPESADKIGIVEVFDLNISDDDNSIQDSTERLINLSTRGQVGNTADTYMIGGFAIEGKSDIKLLIRGVGPSLTSLGAEDITESDVLADPTLWLVDQATGEIIEQNESWTTTAEHDEAMLEAGAFPLISDKDTAIVTTLNPGSYSVILFGADGGSGVGLFELYELGL